MKKLTKVEELRALDATLQLLEFWTWRSQQAGETNRAQSYERGHAVFEENKQSLVWSLSKEELAEYEAGRKVAKRPLANVMKKPAAKPVKKPAAKPAKKK